MKTVILFIICVGSLVGCVESGEETQSNREVQFGLGENLNCPTGQVGFRFPTKPLNKASADYARRAGDKAKLTVQPRLSIQLQEVRCGGSENVDELALIVRKCANSTSCNYQKTCEGSFQVEYHCGPGDLDDDGKPKLYIVNEMGNQVSFECKATPEATVTLDARVECIPKVCHGRSRRDQNMQCVPDITKSEVVAPEFHTTNGLESMYSSQHLGNELKIHGIKNGKIDENDVKYSRYRYSHFQLKSIAYENQIYKFSANMGFGLGLVPENVTMTMWFQDSFLPKKGGRRVVGYRCTAFEFDFGKGHTSNEFSGPLSKGCFGKGRAIAEQNAARKLGLTHSVFLEQYKYDESQLRASYDIEGKTVLHKNRLGKMPRSSSLTNLSVVLTQ